MTNTLSMDEPVRVEWRAEGAAYRATPIKMSIAAGLVAYDLGALLAMSKEVLRDSTIDAELWVRDQLAEALGRALDAAFIDPANSGSGGSKPASVTNGAGASSSPAEVLFDWGDEFSGDPQKAVIILNPFTAARRTGAARPDVGARGGTWGGFPVLTSTAVGAEDIILMDPTQIAVALGNVSIRVSENAAVELVDSSSMASGPSAAAVTVTSMFQTNSLAFIGSITANWRVIRDDAVLLFNTQQFGL